MNYVKQKATTTAKIDLSHFDELKEQYILDIKVVVEMMKIPIELVFNWDHTGINIVPGLQWIMEPKGSKRVELAGLNDKRLFVVKVPPNCTDRLQPMDLSVNKAVKEFLRKKFQQWYSSEVESLCR